MNIKNLVKNKTAKFSYYRDGSLWYSVDDFIFPVPIDDVGTATFLSEDKAILFMRYIRKHLETFKEAQNENVSEYSRY